MYQTPLPGWDVTQFSFRERWAAKVRRFLKWLLGRKDVVDG